MHPSPRASSTCEPLRPLSVIAFVTAELGPESARTVAALEAAGVQARLLTSTMEAGRGRLELAEALAVRGGADWLLLLERTEAVASPWPDLPLGEALALVDALGYDCVAGRSRAGLSDRLVGWRIGHRDDRVCPYPLLLTAPDEANQRTASEPAARLDVRGFATLLHADELAARPELLRDYGATFSADDDATLVVYDEREDPAGLAARLEPIIARAGLDGPLAPDMLGVSVAPGADTALAQQVQAVLWHSALAGLPSAHPTALPALRELAERRWAKRT